MHVPELGMAAGLVGNCHEIPRPVLRRDRAAKHDKIIIADSSQSKTHTVIGSRPEQIGPRLSRPVVEIEDGLDAVAVGYHLFHCTIAGSLAMASKPEPNIAFGSPAMCRSTAAACLACSVVIPMPAA